MKRKIGVGILCFITVYLLYSYTLYAEDRTNLKNTIIKALYNSSKVKAAEAGLNAAEYDRSAVKSKYLPSIDMYADAGYEAADNLDTRRNGALSYNAERRVRDIRNQMEIRLTQPLFDGYNTKYRISAADKDVEASEYGLIGVKEEIAFDAVRAYIILFFANKMYSVFSDAVLKNYDFMDRARADRKAGKIEENDFVEIIDIYNRAIAEESAFLFKSREARNEYIASVGIAPASLLRKPENPSSYPETQKKVYDLLLSGSPLLRAYDAYEKAAADKAKADESFFLPNINLQLARTWQKNVDGSETKEDNERALITFDYNLFAGGGDLALKKKAKALATRARYEKEEQLRIIKRRAQRLFTDMVYFIRRMDTLSKLKDTRETLLQNGMTRLKNKEIGYRDIMKMVNRLLEVEISLLEIERDSLIVKYRILAEGGGLLKSFDL